MKHITRKLKRSGRKTRRGGGIFNSCFGKKCSTTVSEPSLPPAKIIKDIKVNHVKNEDPMHIPPKLSKNKLTEPAINMPTEPVINKPNALPTRVSPLIEYARNLNRQSGINIRKEPPIESRSITEFMSYETFIRKQYDKIPNTIIRPISASSTSGGYNGNAPFNQFEYAIKKYFWGADEIIGWALIKKEYYKLSEIMNYTSLLTVFKNTETIEYLPIYLYFSTGLGVALKTIVTEKDYFKDLFMTPKFYLELYEGKYDEYIQLSRLDEKLQKKINRSVEATNTTERHPYSYSAVIEFSKYFKMLDKYLYSKTIPYILNQCKNGKTICSISNITGINSDRRFNIDHKVATIFWYENNRLFCGIYDPIFYIKDKDSKYYIDPVCAFYVSMKLLASEYKFDVTIINISKYCFEDQKGISCPQYYINAEYCPLYSLYFLYIFSRNGGKHDEASLRTAVKDSYISEPSTISRYVTKENNIFLVTYTSFIMTLLTLVSSRSYFLKMVHTKYMDLIIYNIRILEPSVFKLLCKKLGLD